MRNHIRSLFLLGLILTLAQPFGVQARLAPADSPPVPATPAPAAPAPAAPASLNASAWYDGLIQYSTITNCVSIIQGLPYQESGAGTYVGFLADPDNGQPAPNTTYYVHIVIAGLGNSCSGMRAYVDVSLPANTTLAIDSTNKVYCLFDGVQISPASDCPQSLPASAYNPGAYTIWSPDTANANTWPIPQGRFVEFQIPVRSSTTLTNSPLQANVWMLDGNDSPWLRPQQGVYVFSSLPTILYPSPSTITVTATTARSQAYLYAFGTTGTGYFDLGTTNSYELVHEPVAIATSGTAWLVWDDWGPPPLTPDTLYHWRFTYTSGSQTYFGVDQTFRTLPEGSVSIGQGQSAACTETAFNNALATAKEISFDCGTLPVTITLTSPHTITANLTIEGGNKVTLAASGASNHFNVQAGAHLTLTQITLTGGSNPADCGGAIKVLANGQLTLNETRFIDNHAHFQGGALCNQGTADVSATLFKDNSSTNSHGGAIGNYGSLTLSASKLVSNTAAINGGGIDTVGTLVVTSTDFISNTAGFRGGGINTYVGSLSVTGSSFSSNSAGLYGGGLANDASTTAITASTFSDNTSLNFGGGIETSGVGSLALTNSTLSANHASTEGGGLYWYPGANSGPVTILNSTIAGNTAGTQGGNLYAGGAANPDIQLKNTLVASGSPNNCDFAIASQGSNLESADTCGLAAAGDLTNADPNLGPLQDNGGPTWTQMLPSGSPAIDAGANSGCPASDQRGVARPIDGNLDGSAVCDIGAVEAPEAAPPPPPGWKLFLPVVRK